MQKMLLAQKLDNNKNLQFLPNQADIQAIGFEIGTHTGAKKEFLHTGYFMERRACMHWFPEWPPGSHIA